MPCRTCGHTLKNLGLENERVFYCTRCGSLTSLPSPDFEDTEVPRWTQVAMAAQFDQLQAEVNEVLQSMSESGQLSYGAFLRRVRITKCLSQQEAGDLAGLSRNTVHAVEAEEEVGLASLKALATALGVGVKIVIE